MDESVGPDRWETIEAILGAALGMSPAQRPAYLTEACGGDDALRAEVDSLLGAHARAGDYLEVPAASVRAAFASPYRPGQLVGPYRLEHEIGRGGLGVVFLATDTRLDRPVALKLLSASRTADPEARARFRREARAASSLSHPNICAVYEIGQSGAGDPFIAMAYAEGETLQERIARGPLPVPEAVEVAVQVARGLAHAHERGIVHRDVKPSNLILSREGEVEIVDFGLATWRGASTLTREGATPGTVSYMSPEQIQGGEVDHRTDIWALGVVLYEMLTGQPPFSGDSEQSRIWAILNRDPEPLTAVRAGVPLALEPVLAKALAKDPSKRYQHLDELPVDLRAALDRPGGPVPGLKAWAARPARWVAVLLVTVGLGAGALFTALGLPPTAPRSPEHPIHLSLVLPPEHQLGVGSRRLAISPDGTRLVYTARSGGRIQLYVRDLDRTGVRAIPGTDNARDPFFSPDGRWVGFFADQALLKVSLEGGAPEKITDAPTQTNRGASWGRDGRIVLPLGQWSGLFWVPDTGGVPEPLTVPEEGDRSAHFFPQILQDGRSVLFSIWSDAGWAVAILDLEEGGWKEIAEGCAAARYVTTGYLVCAEANGLLATGSLLAAPLDLRRRVLRGPLVSVPRLSGLDAFDFSISSTGTLVYATGPPLGRRTALSWVDRDGRITRFAEDVDHYRTPALSPDGRQVAVTRLVEAGRQELWLYDVKSGTPSRLSTVGTVNNMPVWSPDGERLIFNSTGSPPGLYSVPRDGSTGPRLLLAREGHILVPGSISPDGRLLAFTELNERTLGDVWVLSLTDGSRSPVLRSPSNERSPGFSPDGHWLSYASDESGRDEVYVRPWPGPGAPAQISTNGGREPVWSAAGEELFYRSGDTVMAVSVETAQAFSANRPTVLFDGPFAPEYLGTTDYDVSPGGRFMMVELEPPSGPVRLEVVLNWFEELENLVPAGAPATSPPG